MTQETSASQAVHGSTDRRAPTAAGQPDRALSPSALSPSTEASAASRWLVDRFGRVHRSLRISVTDRCNIRCQYCMPAVAQFMDSSRLLTFEEISGFVRVVATLGIRKVRITGGEPLMRPGLHELIGQLRAIPGVEDLALTTNGMRLAEQIDSLARAGLKRINISLDTLRDETFKRLSRRDGLDQVLEGIEAAVARRDMEVKLNALVMRDINLPEVLELIEFARQHDLVVRFIEFMPLDADRAWSRQQLVSGQELRRTIEGQFGSLSLPAGQDPSRPAQEYRFADGRGGVGFIDSVSQPFCADCDRLRLTADGKLRNCLFGREEWDVREWLRQAEPSGQLEATIRACLSAKRAAHGIDAADFAPPARAMYQIGG